LLKGSGDTIEGNGSGNDVIFSGGGNDENFGDANPEFGGTVVLEMM
jgi:hypothetical protein